MAEVYYPDKADFVPSKKLYLLRAGFQGIQSTLDHRMQNLTNEIYLEAIPLVQSRITYQTLSIENIGEINIPAKFEGIKKITFFVSTIGYPIEKRIETYSKLGETTKALLLDAWASESIEELNEKFDKQLRRQDVEGTMRFSPGYSDIVLTENNKIIDLLQSDIVTAHPKSGMLSPQKSTVCMIGWY